MMAISVASAFRDGPDNSFKLGGSSRLREHGESQGLCPVRGMNMVTFIQLFVNNLKGSAVLIPIRGHPLEGSYQS